MHGFIIREGVPKKSIAYQKGRGGGLDPTLGAGLGLLFLFVFFFFVFSGFSSLDWNSSYVMAVSDVYNKTGIVTIKKLLELELP